MTTSKPLKQYDSNLVQMLLGLGQSKIAKIMVICLLVWLPWQQKAPIDIMLKGLNCIFSIASEGMQTIFSTYDHLMIVYSVYEFDDQRPFCLVAMATLNFKKRNVLNDNSFKTTEAV